MCTVKKILKPMLSQNLGNEPRYCKNLCGFEIPEKRQFSGWILSKIRDSWFFSRNERDHSTTSDESYDVTLLLPV